MRQADGGINIRTVQRQRMEARRNAGKNMSGDAVAHAMNPQHPFRYIHDEPRLVSLTLVEQGFPLR